jgi:hypothetical protein
LRNTLLVAWACVVVLASGAFEPLSDFFECVPMPNDEFGLSLARLVVVDVVVSVAWASLCRRLFAFVGGGGVDGARRHARVQLLDKRLKAEVATAAAAMTAATAAAAAGSALSK